MYPPPHAVAVKRDELSDENVAEAQRYGMSPRLSFCMVGDSRVSDRRPSYGLRENFLPAYGKHLAKKNFFRQSFLSAVTLLADLAEIEYRQSKRG